ncbi:zinc-binding dehydrogenase [Dactylosporangium sp. CA-092794]|uniref:zinc-binding dehydrogenase n=1 Tax=Dactylosporangium sp. CA-092794 TaxID=3239929 RepID=UPI003D8D2CC7
MWAYQLSGPCRLERVDVERPLAEDLAEDEVLLRTLAGGVCGSDLPKFRGGKGAVITPDGGWQAGRPGFPMHEVVGEVVASRHRAVAVGSRAVGWAVRSDALAEFVTTDGNQLQAVPPGLRPEQAVLIQSLACVWYAVEGLPVAGARVAVVGLGAMGLLLARILKERGAAEVIGVDPVDRTPVAHLFGLDRVVVAPSGPWSASLADRDRPAIVVEAVGHQVGTLQHAIDACAVGGQIVCFGIPDDEYYPLDMERLMRKNLTLCGRVTRRRREMLACGAQYLLDSPELFENLVTHEVPVADVQRAFTLALDPAARLKVVVRMG